jgi:hypothetical protein
MFKTLLKLRHDPPRNDVPVPPLAPTRPPGSVNPVEYGREGPQLFRPVGSAFSVNPVEYRHSPIGPPVPNAPAAVPTCTPSYSIDPVEYTKSPFGPDIVGAPVTSAVASPFPVDYRASAPMPAPERIMQPKAVENPQR